MVIRALFRAALIRDGPVRDVLVRDVLVRDVLFQRLRACLDLIRLPLMGMRRGLAAWCSRLLRGFSGLPDWAPSGRGEHLRCRRPDIAACPTRFAV
jgi:hypothetical protein